MGNEAFEKWCMKEYGELPDYDEHEHNTTFVYSDLQSAWLAGQASQAAGIKDAMRKAVEEEREACAGIADNMGFKAVRHQQWLPADNSQNECANIANGIRQRG